MNLTSAFRERALKAASQLSGEVSSVEIDAMSGYFVTHSNTPLPDGAQEFAMLVSEDGKKIKVHYLEHDRAR